MYLSAENHSYSRPVKKSLEAGETFDFFAFSCGRVYDIIKRGQARYPDKARSQVGHVQLRLFILRRHPMPPITIKKEEDDFMNDLLSGMIANNASKSSKPQPSSSRPITKRSSPVKSVKRQQSSPTKTKQISQLLDGADNWDWDDDFEIDEPSSTAAPVSTRVISRFKRVKWFY